MLLHDGEVEILPRRRVFSQSLEAVFQPDLPPLAVDPTAQPSRGGRQTLTGDVLSAMSTTSFPERTEAPAAPSVPNLPQGGLRAYAIRLICPYLYEV